MKTLINLSPDFDRLDAKEWIESWEKTDEKNMIDGFEIVIDEYSAKVKDALFSMIDTFKKNNWKLYIKGPSIEKIDLNLIYTLGRLSLENKKEIVVSYSPKEDERGKSNLKMTYYKMIRIKNIIEKNKYKVKVVTSGINYLEEKKTNNSSRYIRKAAKYDVDYACDLTKRYSLLGKSEFDLSIEYIHLNKNTYKEVISFLKVFGIKKDIIVELSEEERGETSFSEKQSMLLDRISTIKQEFEKKAS